MDLDEKKLPWQSFPTHDCPKFIFLGRDLMIHAKMYMYYRNSIDN